MGRARAALSSYSWAMERAHLWTESYQGEVLGEELFGLLAQNEGDADHRHQLEVLTVLERSTKELAGPLLRDRGIDLGNTEETLATAKVMADALDDTPWDQFLGSFEPVISEFLAKYRRLVELAPDEEERSIARAYVAHELALAAFARRELGQEEGEPLELIVALPHVMAALGR
jgi:hypothetical protein